MNFVPYSYQAHAIEAIMSHGSTGLFLDMGLGKTVITLTAISNLIALDEIHNALVIAPLQTAQNTWPAELAKWDHLKDLTMSLIIGSAKERTAALRAEADVYVINRENVQWLCDQYKTSLPFDMLVIDELSSFKNPSAKRFKALRQKRPYFKRVVGLTGTPASNGYMDLWSEIYLLDRGERLEKSIGRYRNLYFKPGRMNGYIVYEWRLKPGAKEAIDTKLSDLCLSMKSEDYLELPDRIETEVYVQMNEHERKIYEDFGRDHILPEEGVVGLTAATVQNKLLQMANGFAYDEEGNTVHIHKHKLEALAELAEAAAKPVLVYYNYIADKDLILETFPQAKVLKGAEEVKAWNRGEIPMLLAHPASAGHGLNLQAGGSTVIWYGLPWSLELYQQANARLYRQGQKDTVKIYHILTANTHDDDVLHALNRKNTTQEELLKALKARIKGWQKRK